MYKVVCKGSAGDFMDALNKNAKEGYHLLWVGRDNQDPFRYHD